MIYTIGARFAAIVTICPRRLARFKQNLTNFETDSQEIRHRNQFASDSGFGLYPRVGFVVTNMARPAENVVGFYNKRGTCEQWIKEGKGAIRWTRLSCRSFAANAVRLQLHALAYNLGNFLRTLATPEPIKEWSLTSLKEKLIKIGAKVVSHGRYVAFQMAEVAIPRNLFADVLRLIAGKRPSFIAFFDVAAQLKKLSPSTKPLSAQHALTKFVKFFISSKSVPFYKRLTHCSVAEKLDAGFFVQFPVFLFLVVFVWL